LSPLSEYALTRPSAPARGGIAATGLALLGVFTTIADVLDIAMNNPNAPTGPNGPGPNSPTPNGPTPNGPGPNGPGPNGPSPNGPSPNSPTPNGPSPNGPSPNDPNPNGPADSGNGGNNSDSNSLCVGAFGAAGGTAQAILGPVSKASRGRSSGPKESPFTSGARILSSISKRKAAIKFANFVKRNKFLQYLPIPASVAGVAFACR